MMTNIKIELTDEQRRDLQVQLTGKQRPISRAELTDFVTGVVSGTLDYEQVTVDPPLVCFTPNPDITAVPSKYREKYGMRPDSFWVGWLRGWSLVGREMRK